MKPHETSTRPTRLGGVIRGGGEDALSHHAPLRRYGVLMNAQKSAEFSRQDVVLPSKEDEVAGGVSDVPAHLGEDQAGAGFGVGADPGDDCRGSCDESSITT